MLHACLLLLASGPAAARRSPRRPNDALEPATPAEVRAVAGGGVICCRLLPLLRCSARVSQGHALPYYGPPRGDACSGLWPLPRSYNCSEHPSQPLPALYPTPPRHTLHSYRRGSGSGGDLTPDKQPETGGSIEVSEEQFQFVADNTAAKGSARLQRAFTRFHGHIFSPIRPHSQLAAAAAGAGAEQQGSRAAGAPLFTLDVELGSANESLGLGVDESYSLSIETTVGWGSIGRLSAPTICTPHDHCWHDLGCILPRVPAVIGSLVRAGGALHGLESFSRKVMMICSRFGPACRLANLGGINTAELTIRTVGDPGKFPRFLSVLQGPFYALPRPAPHSF